MNEPFFKDEEPEENRKNSTMNGNNVQEISDKKRIASYILNILTLVFMIIIPVLTHENNPEIMTYAFCAGFILAMISFGFNPKSKASAVILIAGIIIIIAIAMYIIYTIALIAEECGTCLEYFGL